MACFQAKLFSATVVLLALAGLHCGSDTITTLEISPEAGSEDVTVNPPTDATPDQILDVLNIPDTKVDQEQTPDVEVSGCGDGVIQPGEVCDDGNNFSGDGCSANCDVVENDFACPEPGKPCVSTVICGDRHVSGNETCDDGNTEDGDGCSSTCEIEEGWTCPIPGERCKAEMCGDGILAGNETCDDGNSISGDGCSSECKREPGWACNTPNKPCHKTACGDGIPEGDEGCDDGNQVIGDGCSPYCEVEPACSGIGACQSACGDGMILPGDAEECDDGNTISGDGCSSDCKIELGFYCDVELTDLPNELEVPVTFRDFIALPTGGGVKHPDFETYSGAGPTLNMVEAVLGPDGKPVYTGICETNNNIGPCPYGNQSTSKEDYDQWYRDVAGINVTKVSKIVLNKQPNGEYYFPDSSFFPWNDDGWFALGKELQAADNVSGISNFGFTSELRTWFEFKGGEELLFSGDDDVWVFINSQLVVDLGGLHSKQAGSVTLDAAKAAELQLEDGKIYETVLFHAERHTTASNFNLTLTGFVKAKSKCKTICGDGILAGDEECDDGVNDGSYGSCTADCRLGPYCGDAQVQSPHEECDDGVNLTTYSTSGAPGCAPGCKFGAYCGDGKVDSLFGEQCDDGKNEGGYGGCTPVCHFGPRCGDGIIQTEYGEECDDGNLVSGDGCSSECKKEGPK